MPKIKYSLAIPVAPGRDCEILDYIKKLDYPENKFEVVIEEGTNPSLNRNKCFEKSKGEIVCFLDDDGKLLPNYLKKADEFFAEYPEIDIVGGPQLTPIDDGFFAKMSGLAMASFFGSTKMARRYRRDKDKSNASEHDLTSANCFVRRRVMKKVRFNLDLFPGEDPEFFYRAKKEGFKIAYSSKIIMLHRRRPNLYLFWKQFYKYGKVRIEKEAIVEEKVSPLFLLPSLFSIYLIFAIFLSFYSILFLIPLGIYLLAAFMSSFFISLRKVNPIIFFVLPFFYLVIHLSYGFGIIKGIWNKLLN